MAKVFALDQNFFRSGELESLIAADPTAKFVVLDPRCQDSCRLSGFS
ncbi:hypothetical protein BV323_03509 [Pseudomonas syringae pv. actinidiae]|nr:hypothetical protein BV320_03548 [Pseudomonas syringae pv. actinidiae]OSR51716.1 hypothetical protein BV323_03509 [Pseudomonas syringae pv. actinidiae]OSR53914.1 hypothetical protein BV324_03490 [Pseudomonas syringae pv. actinidiae]